jgi:hypothetical protein
VNESEGREERMRQGGACGWEGGRHTLRNLDYNNSLMIVEELFPFMTLKTCPCNNVIVFIT